MSGLNSKGNVLGKAGGTQRIPLSPPIPEAFWGHSAHFLFPESKVRAQQRAEGSERSGTQTGVPAALPSLALGIAGGCQGTGKDFGIQTQPSFISPSPHPLVALCSPGSGINHWGFTPLPTERRGSKLIPRVIFTAGISGGANRELHSPRGAPGAHRDTAKAGGAAPKGPLLVWGTASSPALISNDSPAPREVHRLSLIAEKQTCKAWSQANTCRLRLSERPIVLEAPLRSAQPRSMPYI